jgi:putative FmdB family regulatory protein
MMPTYEYVCRKCAQIIDIVRAITEPEQLVVCPDCDKPMFRHYDVAPAITFNGPGFYKTGG